ncbi:MAG: alpha/beta hydrolase fold domain-containing protein [Gemmatimonadaceae bacterium]|nr:alpha/beta hydrolase fold domain-containing protein [Gemmatimonadaceae bacterium]
MGANEQQMAQLAPAFDPRFIVLSVRSPLVFGPNGFGWFHVTFTAQGPVIVAEEAEAGWTHLARFVDEAVAAYGADPARVFMGGFSQGGIMALATMVTAPQKLAGAISMSGRLLPEALARAATPEALRDKPLLIVHGTADEKLGIHLARWAREQLERLPVALTYRELPMGHAITSQSLGAVTTWLADALDGARRGVKTAP